MKSKRRTGSGREGLQELENAEAQRLELDLFQELHERLGQIALLDERPEVTLLYGPVPCARAQHAALSTVY